MQLTVERKHRLPTTPGTAAGAASAGLAAVVVLRHLGTKPLWRDEAISISVAARPVARLIPVLTHHDANAGLYYLVLHAWLHLGRGAAWARGLSAVCFVLAVGLAAWAGTRWRGWPVGAACGLLLATNPFAVYYGQETRPYALALCLAVVSVIALFWRGVDPAPRAYTVATLALIYTDLFGVLFVAAMAAAVVVVRRSRSEPVPPVLIRCWSIIAVASAPLALVMLLGQRSQISWLPRPRLADLEQTMTAMTAGWAGFLLVAGLGVAAVVSVKAARERPVVAGLAAVVSVRAAQERPVVLGLAAASFLPAPVLWAAAQIVPCFIDRYLICSVVAIVGLAAAGLDALRRRTGPVVALVVLALLVGLGAQRTARLEAEPLKIDDAPGAVAWITSHAMAGDAVAYAAGGMRMVIEASLGRRAPFPLDVALAPGGEAWRQHDLYAREVGAAELDRRLVPVRRLWVVTDAKDRRFPRDGPLAQLRPTVTREFTAGLTGSFDAIDVTLYVRQSSG